MEAVCLQTRAGLGHPYLRLHITASHDATRLLEDLQGIKSDKLVALIASEAWPLLEGTAGSCPVPLLRCGEVHGEIYAADLSMPRMPKRPLWWNGWWIQVLMLPSPRLLGDRFGR